MRAGPAQAPYRATVVFPYLLAVGLLVLLMITAIPRVVDEGVEFSKSVPQLLDTLAVEIKKVARDYGMENVLARYVNADLHGPHTVETIVSESPPGTQPAGEAIDTNAVANKIQNLILGFLPGAAGKEQQGALPNLFLQFAVGVVSGTLQFLLAILLSFLIVLDFEAIGRELKNWRKSSVGQFFRERPRAAWWNSPRLWVPRSNARCWWPSSMQPSLVSA